jgi:CheY-like chemotaxis protein
VITVSLPQRSVSARPPRGAREPDVWTADPTRLDGVRVLVIDDEPDARDLTRAVLEKCGAAVRVAASASEGLARVSEDRPDVIVCDVHMPEVDGYTFVRRLRDQVGAAKVPVLALTAAATSTDRVRALSAGFQMHVAKPVEPEELAVMVASLARAS